jgi:hypothetical protein
VLEEFRRRRQVARVRPGDGSPLPGYRRWQLFTRSLFTLDHEGHRYEVDVRHLRDSSSTRRPVLLYRDGVQVAAANPPVAFPVPGGVIEVATSTYGLTRIHHVADDGAERVLRPHPHTLEGLRARFARRFPRASAAVAVASVAVLLTGLGLTLLTVAEAVGRIPPVAAQIGTITSPVRLEGWAAVAVPAATALAAVERSLALRDHWLLRSGA